MPLKNQEIANRKPDVVKHTNILSKNELKIVVESLDLVRRDP